MWWKNERSKAEKQLEQSKLQQKTSLQKLRETDKITNEAESISKRLLAEVEANGFTELLKEAWGSR